MAEQLPDRVPTYKKLLAEAFDELHAAVLKKLETNSITGTHYDYPRMSLLQDGFPSISTVRFLDETAPVDYVGSIRPTLGRLMMMRGKPKPELPARARLNEFLKSNQLGKKFAFYHGLAYGLDGSFGSFDIDRAIDGGVERYLHLYGTGPLEKAKRNNILRRIFFGTVAGTLPIRLVAPIALTHFEVDRYRLNDAAYITRIPRPTQLARSRIHSGGSGAVETVVMAATHAFVSQGWSIPNETLQGVREGLNAPPGKALETVDRFMACLRAATGAITGCAQVLFLPTRWAIEFYCDLPPVFGSNFRRYPNSFDNYGWTGGGQSVVTKQQLEDVKRIYNRSLGRKEERVSIALKRLNACMTRDDDVDAVLDATIGLEVLLGDPENLALSYKLRMRAGALASLSGKRKPADVAAAVKKVYEARSAIVHGLNKKKSKKLLQLPYDKRFVSERETAADMLRFVIDTLLEHPQYLESTKIDSDLMLRPKA